MLKKEIILELGKFRGETSRAFDHDIDKYIEDIGKRYNLTKEEINDIMNEYGNLNEDSYNG